jgi:hypothetical protein
MQQGINGGDPAVQQEIIDLLQDRRFNKVEIKEIRSLAREHYPQRWAYLISDEAYEVLYRAERYIAPWDRREVGTRRAQLGRLLRGPRGAMGLLRDHEEEEAHIEIDPPKLPLEVQDFPF